MGSDRTPGGSQEALSCRRVSHNSWAGPPIDRDTAGVVTTDGPPLGVSVPPWCAR
jgi:hypothetical protein